MTDADRRSQLVIEARSWVGTPYHLGARVKGAGCDCATLLAEILISCGLADREDLGVYSHDWFHHSQSERYMFRLIRHATKTMEIVAYRSTVMIPGNIILTKAAHSRVYNHGAIVTCWPKIVHSVTPIVEEVDASSHPMWAYQRIAVFDPLVKEIAAC